MLCAWYLVATAVVVALRLPVAIVVELFLVRAPTFDPELSGHEDGASAGAVLEAKLRMVWRRYPSCAAAGSAGGGKRKL